MNKISPLALLALAVIFTRSAHGQNAFENLNFESANVPNLNPPDQVVYIPIASALPRWTGYIAGTMPASQVAYNGISVGAPQISLIGHNSDTYSNDLIGGSYTAVLQAGEYGYPYTSNVSAAIAQTGTVPVTTLSLRFDASVNVVGYLTVTFNGQNITYYPLSAGPNYEVYGGDISLYAGQTGELRFTESPTASAQFAIAFLDNITFSVNPIPEPGTCGLVWYGAVLFGGNWWRKRYAGGRTGDGSPLGRVNLLVAVSQPGGPLPLS